MAKGISWLGRIDAIRKTLVESTRSHHTRRQIEDAFQVQPRTALRILEVVRPVKVGTNYFAETGNLLGLLDAMKDAENPSELMDQLRADKQAASRRQLRVLVHTPYDPMMLYGIPGLLTHSRGNLHVKYDSLEKLGEAMVAVALTLQNDLEEFRRLYEPITLNPKDAATDDVSELFRELEEMEARRAAK